MAPPTRVDVDLKDFLDHVATEQLPGDSHEYRVDILITYPDPRSSTGSPYETRRLFIQGPHGTQGHCIGTLDTVILHGDDQPWTVRLRRVCLDPDSYYGQVRAILKTAAYFGIPVE